MLRPQHIFSLIAGSKNVLRCHGNKLFIDEANLIIIIKLSLLHASSFFYLGKLFAGEAIAVAKRIIADVANVIWGSLLFAEVVHVAALIPPPKCNPGDKRLANRAPMEDKR